MDARRLTSPLALALAILAAGLGSPARAAPTACVPPADLQPVPYRPPPPEEVQTGVTIRTYLLSLNWTPEWCRTNGQGITSQRMDCDRPLGFTLHGLWPNGIGKPYPRYCTPVGQLRLSTVRRMYCRTPSAELIQHEWQAHGACGWRDPDAFFAQAAKLYDRIRMPRIEGIPPERLTAGAVRRAFMGANPWLTAPMIFVQTDRADRLTEVRICYDLKFSPMACLGGNGTPDGTRLSLTHSLNRAF